MTDKSPARPWTNWLLALIAAVFLTSLATTGQAHTEHRKQQEKAQAAAAAQTAKPVIAAAPGPEAMHEDMGEMMVEKDRSSMSFAERVLDWLGRFHPIIVHFPIAFFPAALFTAIVGRKRPAFAAPVQFLVVAGGIIAPISAALGWLDAMSADPDPLLTVHRWLGTAIGVGGLALALWAWRQPQEGRGPGMIVALAVITGAIVVQGWYGGALVHGIYHLDW